MSDQASSVANCGICLVCVKDSYSRDASTTKQPQAEKKFASNATKYGARQEQRAVKSTEQTAKTQDGRRKQKTDRLS
ncbi:MAG: hypothetical protein JST44_20755 [Cyanobacteria bacterium SZAS LIN-5]|nr:hypothetical protein [Cyanobacteria bacterium SZAS LIN-5]